MTERLDLRGQGLQDGDLGPLVEFFNLKEVLLDDNAITSIQVLLRLPHLEVVGLQGNPVAQNLTLAGCELQNPLPAWLPAALQGTLRFADLRSNNLTWVPRWLSVAETVDVRNNPIAAKGLPFEVVRDVSELLLQGKHSCSEMCDGRSISCDTTLFDGFVRSRPQAPPFPSISTGLGKRTSRSLRFRLNSSTAPRRRR